MLKKMLLFASANLAAVLTFIATADLSSFKAVILHEPELPESLRK